jgi:IS605 OrfB family transposase
MKRTIRVRLEPSSTQAEALAETRRVFTAAFNLGAAIGWEQHITNATKLHYAAYYAIKAACPTLVSDLINQARVKAAEAVRSAFALQKVGRKVGQPKSLACPPRYNKNTYKVDWESRTVRMSTTQGRHTIRFRVPSYAEKYVGGDVDTADLIYRKDYWWLHVVVTVPTPQVAPIPEVMGVDLGLVHPAATSTNKFLGAKRWRAVEDRFFKLRRALQKKGTKSAKRHLRRLKGRQVRFRKDCDHVLSKRAVRAVDPGATIAIENLKDIRKRTKIKRKTKTSRRVHAWTFAQFKTFLTYKAEERGCTVVAVDPRHTSQACSRCGHIARNNRRSRGRFQCRSCGFALNADLNAARNIAAKYHAGGAIRHAGGLPVNEPIVSVHGSSPVHQVQAPPFRAG